MIEDLIVTGPMLANVMEDLERNFRVHKYWEAEDKQELLASLPDTRFLATDGHVGCSEHLMEALPGLKIIACFGVGVDAIDLPAAKARGIRVTNTPDVLNDAVAELAMGLMLTLSRRIVDTDCHIRKGHWLTKGYPLTAELTGKTIGILGLGRIGKEIAQRAQAFKMKVVYHGRNEKRFEPYTYYRDLEEMASDVDWLVAVVPGGASTEGLISRDIMKALGSDGALVNLGRGSLIDEGAMIELLKSGDLGGAALDVFENEPEMSEELWSMSNVVLSPHMGSATTKTRWAMADLVVRNLMAYRDNVPLITPVV